jgi:hypothetical protein
VAGGIFGAASSSSPFGVPAAAASFPFGQASSTAAPFGAGSAQSASGLFGPPAATVGGSLFGQAASSPSPFGSSSAFGNAAGTQNKSMFGGTGGGGLFGNVQSSSGGLFGGGVAGFGQQQQQSGTGLFGTTQSSGGLFGSLQPAGGGLFGPQSSAAASSGLFGGQSSGAGLFGGGGAAGGIFGGGATLGAASSSPFFTSSSAAPSYSQSLFSGATASATVAPVAAPPTPALPGQVTPYAALPILPATPELKHATTSQSTAARPADSVDVYFRPSPGVRSSRLSRHRIAGGPPSLDHDEAKKPFERRAPSIFKTVYRDNRLVLQKPLPGTDAVMSPPMPAHGGGVPDPATNGNRRPLAAPTRLSSPPSPSLEIHPAEGNTRRNSHTRLETSSASPPRRSPSARRSASPPPPRLPNVPEDLYIQPPLKDLRLIATGNPNALAAVHCFTVGKHGVGEVMFLSSVDISDAPDLGAIFSFASGGVSVFENAAHKPPVGSGLNCAARVQLQLDADHLDRIVKRRNELEPAQQIAKIQQRLQKLCVETDATFVSVDMIGGDRAVWTFEVKHWSRCGPLSDALCHIDSAVDSADVSASCCQCRPLVCLCRP